MSAKTAKKAAAKVAKPAAAKKAAPAKKAATKKAAKAAKAAPAADAAPEEILAHGTPIIFTELRTPIEGELAIEKGVVVYVADFNTDDKSYNISKTPNGVAVETLYREEFRLATPEELAAAKSGKAAPAAKPAKAVKTDAEADSGSTAPKVKDAAGKTVVPAKKAAAKKAAKKLAKPVPVAEPLPPVKLVASVKTLITEAGGLIKAAEQLADRSGATDFSLGGILAKIEETNAFEELKDADGTPTYGTGHLGFGKFVELHLGMKYRKATYVIKNYRVLTALGITEKQILGIGWSKLVHAAGVMTSENVDEIISEAKTKPFGEFKAAMKQRLIDGGGKLHGNTRASLVRFTFDLHNDKGQVAIEALTKAKAQLGIEGKDIATNSQAFDLILSEWLSMKD